MAKRRSGPSRAKILLTGDKKLDRKLKTLAPKLRNKIARKAMRKAAKPVLDTAKAMVPVDEGTLKKSLVIRAMKRSKKNKGRIGVRVTTKEGLFAGETFYGGFIEYGTAEQPPRPFLKPALNANKGRVDAILKAEIWAAIQAEASSK